MKVVNKVKEKIDKHKTEIAIGGGLVLMCATWFCVGAQHNFIRMSRGLGMMFDADPELKERMWDAIGKAKGLKP